MIWMIFFTWVADSVNEALKETHQVLLDMSVPLLNWLGALDNGEGRQGLQRDATGLVIKHLPLLLLQVADKPDARWWPPKWSGPPSDVWCDQPDNLWSLYYTPLSQSLKLIDLRLWISPQSFKASLNHWFRCEGHCSACKVGHSLFFHHSLASWKIWNALGQEMAANFCTSKRNNTFRLSPGATLLNSHDSYWFCQVCCSHPGST